MPKRGVVLIIAAVVFAAVPGSKGGEDITGPYDPVADWPKPLSQLPGHDGVDVERRRRHLRGEPQPCFCLTTWRRAYLVVRDRVTVHSFVFAALDAEVRQTVAVPN